MAHEYVMNYMASPDCKDTTVSNIVSVAWSYADLMQAEADKRKITAPDEIPKHERLIPFDESHEHDYIYGRICACGSIKE